WLAEPRPELVAAVAEGVRDHVRTLTSRGIEFYGYALLPGEPYEIYDLVAVTNSEADIKVPSTDERYRYYRFAVDEWANWEPGKFVAASTLLVQANERFASMHSKPDTDYVMDEFEIAYADVLLDAVVRGLEKAKLEGVFGAKDPFLAVWISDS